MVCVDRKDLTLKIFLQNLGCDKNLVDGEKLLAKLYTRGYESVSNPEAADLVVVNTCGFIEAAKEESIEAIISHAKTKKVAVVGCLAERYRDQLRTDLKEADVVLGLSDAPETFEGLLDKYGALEKPCSGPPRILTTLSHTSPIKISEGCNRACAFCAIPLIRGAHRARPPEEVVKEAQFLRTSGVKELLVVAQDPTSYAEGIGLHGLLKKIDNIPSPFEWIRLMYVHPSGVTDKLIEALAESAAMSKYIDMPLQHISDPILKSMNRSYTRARAEEIIEKLRSQIPGIAIRTTFMVGYPGEKETHFEELQAFVEEMAFDRVGMFGYSPEEGTEAFKLKGRLPGGEIRNRMEAIQNIQIGILRQKNEAKVGTVEKVLIDSIEGDEVLGRTAQDAPEVDCAVKLNGKDFTVGEFYDVTIKSADEYELTA